MPGKLMRSLASFVVIISLLVIGCQRAESVAPSEVDKTPTSSAFELKPTPLASATARTTSAPQTACVVPMSKVPLPQAKPAERCPLAPNIAVPPTHGRITFIDTAEKRSIDVELAENADDQQRGLMYRKTMNENAGMLFSWSDERIRTFWMHNTCLPLDMLFIAKDGTIAGILEQVPVLNDEPRSIACPVTHVLEVNAGFCRRHGITPGQRVQLFNN
jgi:uncharacterized membrane protein (UPF0127 family)